MGLPHVNSMVWRKMGKAVVGYINRSGHRKVKYMETLVREG